MVCFNGTESLYLDRMVSAKEITVNTRSLVTSITPETLTTNIFMYGRGQVKCDSRHVGVCIMFLRRSQKKKKKKKMGEVGICPPNR
jgi:hypothetical protein